MKDSYTLPTKHLRHLKSAVPEFIQRIEDINKKLIHLQEEQDELRLLIEAIAAAQIF